jgi:8-oxo-dGTP diphosphatase
VSNDKSPSLMVDAIVEKEGKILLVKRKKDPFKDKWSFPGGKVDSGERVEDAIKRELLEETSLTVEPTDILGVYSDPDRDPRGHRVTTVFISKVEAGEPEEGDDAASAQWFPINDEIELAFDHNKLLNHYRQWLKSKQTFWSSKR